MAVTLNASTSSGLVQTADTSGEIQLQSNGSAIGTFSSTGLTMASGKKVNYTGAVLQVVSTVKSDTFTTTSGSYVDVTGLSVSITPTSATSKILVLIQINGSQEVGAGRTSLKLLRDSTVIDAGDVAGSRTPALGGFSSIDSTVPSAPVSGNFLDSPATTSSTTYKIQVAMAAGSGSAYINRTQQDSDNANQIRMASTITVMEIAA